MDSYVPRLADRHNPQQTQVKLDLTRSGPKCVTLAPQRELELNEEEDLEQIRLLLQST